MAPRLLIYGTLSSALFLSVTLSALSSRPNFYSAAIQIGRSSASLMVLWNFGVFGAICLGLGIKRVFFGSLRAIEYEVSLELCCGSSSGRGWEFPEGYDG
jgi:E3 ubiquitin-protein ligase synoviolin